MLEVGDRAFLPLVCSQDRLDANTVKSSAKYEVKGLP